MLSVPAPGSICLTICFAVNFICATPANLVPAMTCNEHTLLVECVSAGSFEVVGFIPVVLRYREWWHLNLFTGRSELRHCIVGDEGHRGTLGCSERIVLVQLTGCPVHHPTNAKRIGTRSDIQSLGDVFTLVNQVWDGG